MKNDIKVYFETLGFEFVVYQRLLSDRSNMLFNISGGIRYEQIIEGLLPSSQRICSIQRCLRTDNLSQIGKSGRHHIFFEMLGHFSFSEFSEKEGKSFMILSAWNLLTDILGIEPEKLFLTIHPNDKTSIELSKENEIPYKLLASNVTVTRIRKRTGYRVEIFWKNPYNKGIELWNIVFTQFDENSNPLPLIVIDSGTSIDRLRTAKENCDSNYQNSDWRPYILEIKNIFSLKTPMSSRVSDLLKAIFFLLKEDIKPSNKREGYVLRRLIRTVYMLIPHQLEKCEKVFRILNKKYYDNTKCTKINDELLVEFAKFSNVIKSAKRKCKRMLKLNNGILTKREKLVLKETYGLPIEITNELMNLWKNDN